MMRNNLGKQKNILRKLIIILCITLSFSMLLSSCREAEEQQLSTKIRLGTLNGPTGMGLIQLEDKKQVKLNQYRAPDEVVQKLLSNEIDVACLPSNMGAVIDAKTNGQFTVLSTIVNGVLYICENGKSVKGFEDFKGKTIYASGMGGTPEYVLQAILEKHGIVIGTDVEIVWMDSHSDVAQQLLANKDSIALLPEPFVSTVCAKSKKVRIAVDMNKEWEAMTDSELPMGILIANKDFVEKHPEDIELFLGFVTDSINDVNEASDKIVNKIVKAGYISDKEICKTAIPRCSLTNLSAKLTMEGLQKFYKILYSKNPASVGGKLPSDELYYYTK